MKITVRCNVPDENHTLRSGVLMVTDGLSFPEMREKNTKHELIVTRDCILLNVSQNRLKLFV